MLDHVHWSLSLKTAPTAEPVTLEEAKAQCRIASSVDDEDGLIQSYIEAAREFAEARTGRACLTQTWYLRLDKFPWWDTPIWIPKPPLRSVTAITYVDTAGATQTWSSSQYQVSAPAGPTAQYGRILPAYSYSYPSAREQMDAVTIEFVCGSASPEDVPMRIRQAILALVAHQYEHREPIVVGTTASELPHGALALLDSVTAVRW